MTSTTKNNDCIRLVLPKKGRLKADFEDIMLKAGFKITKQDERQDYGTATDTLSEIKDFEILFQRPSDGLKRINTGIANLAIVGTDKFIEAKHSNKIKGNIAEEFNGISECKLYIAAPINERITKLQDLSNKTFATSYPATLKAWLTKNKVQNFSIITYEGGIEDTIRLGEADIICDVVESGRTLTANGLEAKIKIMNSKAILVQNTENLESNKIKQIQQIKERLAKANQKVQKSKKVLDYA